MERSIGRLPRWLACQGTTDVSIEDMRDVAILLRRAGVSTESYELYAQRVLMTPAERLSTALVVCTAVLQLRPVDTVIPDALTGAEVLLLLEAEDAGLSSDHLSVIHSVLAAKERWALNKSLSGFFTKARAYKREG